MDACVCLNLFCIYSGLFIFNGGLNACSFLIVIRFISNNKQTFDLTTTNTFAFVHGIIICICLFAWIFNASLLSTIKFLLAIYFHLKPGLDYASSFLINACFYSYLFLFCLFFCFLVLFFFLSLLAHLGDIGSPKGSQLHGPVRTVGNFFVKCTTTSSLV